MLSNRNRATTSLAGNVSKTLCCSARTCVRSARREAGELKSVAASEVGAEARLTTTLTVGPLVKPCTMRKPSTSLSALGLAAVATTAQSRAGDRPSTASANASHLANGDGARPAALHFMEPIGSLPVRIDKQNYPARRTLPLACPTAGKAPDRDRRDGCETLHHAPPLAQQDRRNHSPFLAIACRSRREEKTTIGDRASRPGTGWSL